MWATRNPSKTLSRGSWICSSCLQKRGKITGLSVHAKYEKLKREKRRFKYGEKLDDAEAEWAAKAADIKEGKQKGMLSILEERGYVNQIAGNRDELDQLMTQRRIGAYAGIDPTAPSLHVGHLLPLMVLLWLYVHGFQAVTLLGGSTARIGDPIGRSTTRESIKRSEYVENMTNMHLQIRKFWANMEAHAMNKYGYQRTWAWTRGLVNNNAWWNQKTSFLDVLRFLGSPTRIGAMLSRDTVKTRMEKGDGMSYAEFSYPLMQAWDWWQLFKQRDIQLQIGGADQFGNIVAGIEGVNCVANQLIDGTVEKTKVGPLAKRFGLTVPLLTTASGEKYGKSAGNAIWLDPQLTSIFEQYQFFLRSADDDVGRYLRLFTLVPTSDIDKLLEEHSAAPHERKAQHRLAYEVMCLIHGRVEADKVAASHDMLFTKPYSPASPASTPNYSPYAEDINPALNRKAAQTNSATNYPYSVTIPRTLVTHASSARVLYAVGLVSSRSEGDRLINAGGAYVGRQKGNDPQLSGSLSYVSLLLKTPGELAPYLIEDSLLILRAGKWNVKIARVISDEEFEEKALDVPGWQDYKKLVAERSLGEASKEEGAEAGEEVASEGGSVIWKAAQQAKG